MSIARTRAAYAEALASPYALICLVGVFTGGCIMFGLTPFIDGRLEKLGLGGLKESGFVIGALSVGGVCFTLLVRRLLAWLGRGLLARTGGTILAVSLVAFALAPEWHLEALAFGCAGFGFFMMHNCLQALGTELAPKSRASGISLMAFVFFLGQACGPVLYTAAFHRLGQYVPIYAAAAIVLVMSWWVSVRLNRMDRAPAPVSPGL
jgi:predicted MFS family arabinose efflux permease